MCKELAVGEEQALPGPLPGKHSANHFPIWVAEPGIEWSGGIQKARESTRHTQALLLHALFFTSLA